MTDWKQIFSRTTLRELFPQERTDAFFDALFGDASEGAYDIELSFDGYDRAARNLRFLLNLRERPGRCLACNLTYGLPQVFSRHPLLAVGKLAQTLCAQVQAAPASWELTSTREISRSLHVIPFIIKIA